MPLGIAGTGATCATRVDGACDGMNCAARWEVGSGFGGDMVRVWCWMISRSTPLRYGKVKALGYMALYLGAIPCSMTGRCGPTGDTITNECWCAYNLSGNDTISRSTDVVCNILGMSVIA